MNFKQAVVVLVSRFPFEAVSERMNLVPRWKWEDGAVPTARHLRARAYQMFAAIEEEMDVSPGTHTKGTGGIWCRYENGKVTLKFGKSRDVWAEDSEEVDV